DIILLAPDTLRSRLRTVIHKAARDNEPATEHGIMIPRNGDTVYISVTARPLLAPRTEGLYLVVFEDEKTPSAEPRPHVLGGDDAHFQQLENELKATREDLQSTIEELESSNEEMKASNEEVMSMNEELQSANEELETSKEELQSLNEEMSTVNSQLQEK